MGMIISASRRTDIPAFYDDSCLFGCAYCYATSNLARARTNHGQHHPDSPSLIGWHEAGMESAQLPLQP